MSIFTIGGAHEFEIAATKLGWRAQDLDKLAKDERLCADVLMVLRGQAEIVARKYVVDCSVLPPPISFLTPLPAAEQIPSRFTGELTLTPEALALHLDPGQQDGKVIKGTALRTALASAPVYTAHVLDAYLEHPELIPESLKKDANGNTIYTFFWGTIYRDSHGRLCVRCLYWLGGWWDWNYRWLEGDWSSRLPAAVPAGI